MKQVLTRKHFQKFMRRREPGLKASHPGWPDFCCTWTCAKIIEDLRKEFRGTFELRNGHFDNRGHTWIVQVETGKILDPTVRQFASSMYYPHAEAWLLADLRHHAAYRLFHKRDRKMQALYTGYKRP